MRCCEESLAILPNETEMSIDDLDRRVWVWESISSFLLFQMMVDGVNGVPTNPYAAMSQLSGLAEVIVDSGRKATPV